MAIDWGSYNGHLRIGIDHTISPSNPSHSDTSVTVTWKYYLGTDGWNFSGDSSSLHEGADGWGGTTTNFTNNLSSGDMLVDTHSETYSIGYSSGSKSANANLTGAYNGATPSHSVSVNLPDRPVAAPSNGEAANSTSVTATGFTVTWSTPTDNGGASVDNYEVQLCTGPNFGTGIVADWTAGNGATFSHAFTGLDSNRKYYYRVRAHNSAGWGDWTDSSGDNVTTLSGTPSTPSSLTSTSKDQTSITLGWGASSNNGGTGLTYTAECYSNSGLTTLVHSDSGLTATADTFTGLTAGTTYYFRVKATNSNGDSSWTTTLSVATKATTTYTDSGDYVTLVNNLASAVADKLVHLGISLWCGKIGSTTISNSSDTTLNMGTQIESVGPDAPSYTGSGLNDFTINYPGVYEIEFFYRWNESGFASGKHMNNYIYINGVNLPSSTVKKAGTAVTYAPAGASAVTPGRSVTITRRLDAGDTVGWGVWQNSGSSNVPPAPVSGTDLYCWGKVTLVGL